LAGLKQESKSANPKVWLSTYDLMEDLPWKEVLDLLQNPAADRGEKTSDQVTIHHCLFF
jgi:hypothetical protein